MTQRVAQTLAQTSGPVWWPLALVFRPAHAGVARVRRAWLAAFVVTVALAAFEAIVNLSGIPVTIGGITFPLSIYPPLVVTICLALWLGPMWAVIPAWTATFVSGLIAGMAGPLAALFACATPLEVVILWGSFVILDLPPDLPRWRHVFAYVGVVLVAATASSLAGLLYIDSLQLDVLAGQRIWEGWILGDVLQLTLLGAPILHWAGPPVRQWVDRHLDAPPRFAVSYTRSVLIVATLVAVLVLVVFQGVWRVTLSLDIPASARTATGEPLLPRLREMGLFVGLLVAVTFATTTAFAAALARLGERERGVSQRDPLTGTLNRRSFGPHFQREADRSHRLGMGLSLLFLDVDHFKGLNDSWGHEIGDQVLRQLAYRIQASIREHDLLFRWGGDEFVVLMPHTLPADAAVLAERIRAAISAEALVRESVPAPLHVTVSLGAAGLSSKPFDAEVLLGCADRALYGAKSLGRDRVGIAE
ncbi:MAG: diguanylate cyclase [Gemmatimonadales bacterium]